jgi:thioesterase III
MYTIDLTVRRFHCDMFAHVNNARYLEFLEEARWEWLNTISSVKYFQEKNISFIVVSVHINYRRPAVLNDVLSIVTTPQGTGQRSATVKQEVIRKADGKLIADAEVVFAIIDNHTGKSIVLDDEMKELFTRLPDPSDS